MASLRMQLTRIVGEAFQACGYDAGLGDVQPSRRPDLCQFQCNGPLAGAKVHKKPPLQIAREVQQVLLRSTVFAKVETAAPGFLNLTVTDEQLVGSVRELAATDRFGCEGMLAPLRVVIDFGGANVAKPLHVGHLRSAILGESLKRIGRILGHRVLGDVHLGDWGLQMGMLIVELAGRRPDLPYFDPLFEGEYPKQSPVTVAELDELYPVASGRAKADEAFAASARQATAELQAGRRGYRALWRHFVDVSIADLKRDYDSLGVQFDLWLGESDTKEEVEPLVDRLLAEGKAAPSQGAVIVDVRQEGDAHELPPLLLRKADGAALYGTTDLATIAQRVRDYDPDVILYVVDTRQSDHFSQVFRAARITGVAPERLQLEHIGFGTMNGPDGKPFRTRAGGTMKLKDLIGVVHDVARQRLSQSDLAQGYPDEEKQRIVQMVAMATLKFADLATFRTRDYVFDPDRFSSFEGRTGPYLLYAAVRAKAILRKAAEAGAAAGVLLPPKSAEERELLLGVAEFPEAVAEAWSKRAPNLVCDYAHRLASLFSAFYHEHRIIQEPDEGRRASYLALTQAFASSLCRALDLLGIEVPERI